MAVPPEEGKTGFLSSNIRSACIFAHEVKECSTGAGICGATNLRQTGSPNHSYFPNVLPRGRCGVPTLCAPSGWLLQDYSVVADFQLQCAGSASAHTHPLPITCIRPLRLRTIAKPFDVTGLMVRNPSFHFPRDKFLEPQKRILLLKTSSYRDLRFI